MPHLSWGDAVAAAGMPDGDDTRSGFAGRHRGAGDERRRARPQGQLRWLGADDGDGGAELPADGADGRPWTVARAAASNPAALLGAAGERYGALAVGKQAAFTLLGDDGSVCCVR